MQPPRIVSSRRVVFAAGGTAGHVYPALALADAYRNAVPGAEVLFLGAPNGMEARLVPNAGHRLLTVPGSPLFGTSWKGQLSAAANLWRGVARARRVLQEEHSELVLGFGGYASAGALLAALTLRLPTAIYEPNEAPGLTNRWMGRLVRRVYAGSPGAARPFASNALVTGVPVRASMFRVGAQRRARTDRSGSANVLVTGGSLGSRFLNRRAPELLTSLRERGLAVRVWHQAGRTDCGSVAELYKAAALPARVDAYIEKAEEAYAWADFAIICAGATTLAEVSAACLPALVTPLSTASERHQIANARAFAERTGLAWVTEEDWKGQEQAAQIARILIDPVAYTATRHRLAAVASVDAAHAIVADCELLISGE